VRRNFGLREAEGEIICFPENDCWYGDDLLAIIAQRLTGCSEWDGVLGDAMDKSLELVLPRRDKAGPVRAAVCWRRAATFTYFLRGQVAESTGGFDEAIGPDSGTL